MLVNGCLFFGDETSWAEIITALEVQKRDKERVNVYLDGEFAFGLPVIEAARLHTGQELSEDEIKASARPGHVVARL